MELQTRYGILICNIKPEMELQTRDENLYGTLNPRWILEPEMEPDTEL